MSYILDGIRTRMTVGGYGYDGREAKCPCGETWVVRAGRSSRLPTGEVDRESLRFHFTHCPQAKLPTPEDTE